MYTSTTTVSCSKNLNLLMRIYISIITWVDHSYLPYLISHTYIYIYIYISVAFLQLTNIFSIALLKVNDVLFLLKIALFSFSYPVCSLFLLSFLIAIIVFFSHVKSKHVLVIWLLFVSITFFFRLSPVFLLQYCIKK